MLPHQLLLEEMGRRTRREMPGYQCYWLVQCCYQYYHRRMDACNPDFPTYEASAALEKEDRGCNDVHGGNLVSIIYCLAWIFFN